MRLAIGTVSGCDRTDEREHRGQGGLRKLRLCRYLASGLLCAAAASPASCSRPASQPWDGVILFAPLHSSETQLRNNQHEVLHSWHTQFPPGQCVYLMPDGSLLRTARLENPAFARTYGKGSGGRVEWLEWDGTERWRFTLSTDTELLHHDIEPMENGNILMLVWVKIPLEDVLRAGCRTASEQSPILSERIIEVDPKTEEIVWRWDAWDHIYQSVDPNLPSYGTAESMPGRIDVNVRRDINDWLHFNSITYCPDRDLIAVSCRQTSEVYLIDHGTTTAEAKAPSGGARGVGGDILARWGNQPGNRVLYHQHNAHWIPRGLPGAGNLLIFNNGHEKERKYSNVIEVHFDELSGRFDVVWEYHARRKKEFYSQFVSGAQRLPNGHTLICSGGQGWTFEVDQRGRICWEHRYPVQDRLDWVFRVEKYPWSFTRLPARRCGRNFTARSRGHDVFDRRTPR